VPKKFALRRTRKGTGVLPPNPTRWEHEHNALDLRHELSVPLHERLGVDGAFTLLSDVHLCSSHELDMDACFKDHFAGTRSGRWSGMCVPCPNGITLVLYNATHPETRTRATLMEEFFHLWLEHPPDRLRLFSDGEGQREFDGGKESEAYGSGAAALVPYQAQGNAAVRSHGATDRGSFFGVRGTCRISDSCDEARRKAQVPQPRIKSGTQIRFISRRNMPV
jgi:IrrE N-terminal-like domain